MVTAKIVLSSRLNKDGQAKVSVLTTNLVTNYIDAYRGEGRGRTCFGILPNHNLSDVSLATLIKEHS